MKKSSIFLLLIALIASIFYVSFYGAQARNDQFKSYLTYAEITGYTLRGSDEELPVEIYTDDDTHKTYKEIYLPFDQQDGLPYLYISYNVGPKEATNADAFELKITSQVPQALIDGEMRDLATLDHNIVTFYGPCWIRVVLHTIDGSELSDNVRIKCYAVEEDDD